MDVSSGMNNRKRLRALVKSLWVRVRWEANNQSSVMGVCYKPPKWRESR